MLFKDFLLESSLQKIEVDSIDEWYYLNIRQDSFIHFTEKSRIPEIIKSNKLMFRPPYEKFGSDAVNAISLIYGNYVPGVQYTHIKNEVGAIWFTTSTIPYRGMTEEVVWHQDVVLNNVKEVDKNIAISKIKQSPENIDEMANVIYQSYENFSKAHKALIKSWGW